MLLKLSATAELETLEKGVRVGSWVYICVVPLCGCRNILTKSFWRGGKGKSNFLNRIELYEVAFNEMVANVSRNKLIIFLISRICAL